MNKIIFKIVTILTILFSLSSCAKKSADVVIVFSRGSMCLAPLHVAAIKGYYEEEFSKAGLTYTFEEVDVGTSFEVIGSGKASASATLSASTIPAIDNGLNIAFTSGLHTGCTKYLVKKDSNIKTINDLKGKKIGVINMGDSALITLKRILFENGFKVNGLDADVEFVNYSPNDMPLALQNGAIDVASLHDPVAYKAKESYGFEILLDTLKDPKFSNEYCCQSYVTTKLIKENPKAAAAYTRAIMKGCAFVKANPKESAKLQIENNFVTGDIETNSKILELLNYNPSVKLGSETVKNIVYEMKAMNEIKAEDPEKFYKEHFVALEGVPESYVYNQDGTFTEIW